MLIYSNKYIILILKNDKIIVYDSMDDLKEAMFSEANIVSNLTHHFSGM